MVIACGFRVCLDTYCESQDCLDLLEKRVKSRFSHRQTYFFPPSEFEEFKSIAKEALRLPEKMDFDPEYLREFNLAIEVVRTHYFCVNPSIDT
jgi:hypothetical protein